MRRFVTCIFIAFCCGLLAKAQPQAIASLPDTAKAVVDSLVRELQSARMNEMLMRNALEASGHTAYEDSIRKVRQQQRIDSLRRALGRRG